VIELAETNRTGGEFWKPTILAAVTLLVSTGIRNTTGLFVNPLVENTVMSLTDVSIAMAIGQFTYGLFQPLGGLLTTKYKTFTILFSGALCLITGLLGIHFAQTTLPLVICFGLLAPAGAAATSFPVLMGHISKALPDDKRSLASGLISAGGSAGQFIMAPLIQICVNNFGYYSACVFLAFAVALSLLPSWCMCRAGAGVPISTREDAAGDEGVTLKEEIKGVFRKPDYLILHGGFLACGFHVASVATHLPGEMAFFKFNGTFIALCFSILGIFNIAGCVAVGVLARRFRLKDILAGLYAARVIMIALYLAAPKTEAAFILFAAVAGLSFGSTVPPTGDIASRLVRSKYYSTLFGLIFVTHQIGSFFGAWLGGYIKDQTGSFFYMWVMDICVSIFAAAISFKIAERGGKTAR
jgi:predicted MFS family arabinose efflux permease